MKLTYQTSIATFIQFIALFFLNIGTGAVSVVSKCTDQSGDCISNLLVSLIFFMLITFWFGFIWILGYTAQERRSKKLAQLLIACEILIALVALFNAVHRTDPLSLATSLIDFGLSIWVIVLAYRLMNAHGGRIVSKQKTQKRVKL